MSEIPVSLLAFKSRAIPNAGASVSIITSIESVKTDKFPAESLVLNLIVYGLGLEASSRPSLTCILFASASTITPPYRTPEFPINSKRESFVATLPASSEEVSPDTVKVGLTTFV